MPAARTVEEKSMDVLYERVAGLDVHKDTVVACVRIMVDGKTARECRTFATTTEQLVALRAWLEECRCTHVAMEATGVYWMPVFRLLDADKFALIVANAAHIKNVPGRKTDMNDAMWIADLLACGLIQASFVPNEEVQELRALTRTRKQLVREQTRHVQRIEKTLAEANIKLTFRALIELLTTVPGVSGVAAPAILSEIGPDMSRFPTAGHLVAWAGLCPGHNESAGKSSRLRKGAPWLKTMLVQCAWAAKRAKHSYYSAQFHRLCGRRGPQKAICAVAASILTAIYHMVQSGTSHRDLGADDFDRRTPE